VLAARIDRLEPDAKRTLQTAAVIGKEFALPLLERVSDLPPEGLARALDALKDAEFIYEQAIYPEVEYTFKHALTQEVAAQGLLAERRRELHGRVGEAIESLYPTRIDEYVGALAHHFAQSGDCEKAVRYLYLAGIRAARLGVVDEAKRLLEEARAQARELPGSEGRDRRRMDILKELAVVVLVLLQEGWEGDLEGIDEELTEVAASLGAFTELAAVYSSRALPQAGATGPRGVLRCAEKVRALTGRLADEEIAWHAGYAELVAHYLRGEFRPALAKAWELLRRPDIDRMAPASELTPLPVAAYLLIAVVGSLTRIGQFGEVEPLLAQVRAVVAREERPPGLALLRLVEGLHLSARGQPEAAARVLAEGVAYGEQAGLRRLSALARQGLGVALSQTGQFKQTVEVLSEALEILGGADWASASVLPHRARAYLGAGQVAEARHDAETALAMTRQFEDRAGHGEAHLSMALVHAASQPPDYAAAEEEFGEAEECLRECEYRTELAAALRARGEMRLKTQGAAAAAPLLQEARELYAYMDRQDDVAAVDALLKGEQPGKRSVRRKSRS